MQYLSFSFSFSFLFYFFFLFFFFFFIIIIINIFIIIIVIFLLAGKQAPDLTAQEMVTVGARVRVGDKDDRVGIVKFVA